MPSEWEAGYGHGHTKPGQAELLKLYQLPCLLRGFMESFTVLTHMKAAVVNMT